jgi:lipid II:glycine glycyltransferase (peptidoglycan interpeptide bridge formation enzyme)
VCLTDDNQIGLPDLTYYVGPLWSHEVYPMPAHRWLSRITNVYDGFIETFLEKYGGIQACLPKALHDVRPFDWWNYHQPHKPRFEIKPRYTACIQNLDKKNEKSIIADFRQLRRRELRTIEKSGTPLRTHITSVDDILNLYKSVMEKQDVEIEAKRQREIVALTELVNQGFGEIIGFQDPKSSTTIAACLLLYAKREANMVLNLVNSEWLSSGLPAWMITESIKTAKSKGMTIFDFNGANSPNRGDDKHSYGGVPVVYFTIEYPGAVPIE